MPLSYRNQSIDLPCKSMDWFSYDRELCQIRLKWQSMNFLKVIYCQSNKMKIKSAVKLIFSTFSSRNSSSRIVLYQSLALTFWCIFCLGSRNSWRRLIFINEANSHQKVIEARFRFSQNENLSMATFWFLCLWILRFIPPVISLVFHLHVKPSPPFSGTILLQLPFSGMSAINLPKRCSGMHL